MIYRKAFEQFLVKKAAPLAGYAVIEKKRLGVSRLPVVHEYVQKMYFENPHCCVPAEYLGEDLMNDIHTKFYYPLAFLDGFS